MLRIYSVALELARDSANVARVIALQDLDLAKQLRRAAASVPLNVAEASGVQGGNRRLRYATALGSARETMACFDVATAMDYIKPLDFEKADRIAKVIAILVKVSR